MNLTYFRPKLRGNVENKNNPVNIRFVAKTSDIRNLAENIRSDVKTSKVATVVTRQWRIPTEVPIFPKFPYNVELRCKQNQSPSILQ